MINWNIFENPLRFTIFCWQENARMFFFYYCQVSDSDQKVLVSSKRTRSDVLPIIAFLLYHQFLETGVLSKCGWWLVAFSYSCCSPQFSCFVINLFIFYFNHARAKDLALHLCCNFAGYHMIESKQNLREILVNKHYYWGKP